MYFCSIKNSQTRSSFIMCLENVCKLFLCAGSWIYFGYFKDHISLPRATATVSIVDFCGGPRYGSDCNSFT